MTGYTVVNLKLLIEEKGEEFAKEFLSRFSCPLNQDVEDFLRRKAVDFSKQGFSQTHLVMAPYKEKAVLVGYFTLANKYITVSAKKLSSTLKKRVNKFAIYTNEIRGYTMSAPLIAQLGKNFESGYNELITGDELLGMACKKVNQVQYDLGGRFAYLECEDKPKLIEFYKRNGFTEFDKRKLDKDETGLDGEELVQMLRYFHGKDI